MIVIITIITTEIGDCKNRRDTELVTRVWNSYFSLT